LGWGIASVFRVAAFSVFLMFWVTLFFYREPARSGEEKVASVGTALKNIFVVLRNLRFLLFLLIFSGFFAIFWQQYVSVTLFLRHHVDPNANFDLLLSVDSITVISLQILIAFLTQKMPAFVTMTLGFLVTSLAYVLPALHPSMPIFVVALVFVAIGEIMQVSRYYDYISRVAPPGQQGLYMGYAFLPIGIGYFIAGWLGGRLLHYFGEAGRKPQHMWWVIAGVGIFSTILMLLYDKFVKPREAAKTVP
jgi:POT family proton-dependent oligopeptide transporter